MKSTYITLTVSTSEDSLFGSEEAPAKYNTDKLLDAIERQLKLTFPELEIDVLEGSTDKVDTDLLDYGDIDTIHHISQQCWETWIEKLS
jgi:uncharacterized protein YjfI (DUF2170 family)